VTRREASNKKPATGAGFQSETGAQERNQTCSETRMLYGVIVETAIFSTHLYTQTAAAAVMVYVACWVMRSIYLVFFRSALHASISMRIDPFTAKLSGTLAGNFPAAIFR
jgi:hypothetical protein